MVDHKVGNLNLSVSEQITFFVAGLNPHQGILKRLLKTEKEVRG